MPSIYDFLPTEASNSTTGGVNAAEGMDPSAVNDASRAWKQLQARWLDDIGGVVTVGGTGDSQTVTLAEGMTALATGMVFGWKAPGANTGAAVVTVTNSAAAVIGTNKKIRRKGDTACSAGDMISGGFYLFRYDETADTAAGAFILLNPEAAVTYLTNAQAVAGTKLDAAANAANLSAAAPKVAQGRLTLTTAVPVLSADVTAATTIYWALYGGSYYPWYNGTDWTQRSIAELSMAMSSNAAHTGYQQSGKNFDLFLTNDAGTDRLVTGPAWTNDTTRAAAISRVGGILVNTSSMTARFGSASGNTITVAASQGTYVGTMRASADGQTQVKFGSLAANGGEAWIGIWNAYNRCEVKPVVRDSTDSWTYATATWRAANAQNTMRVSIVRGLDEDAVEASYSMAASLSGGVNASVAIGLDSTSSPSGIYPLFNASGYMQATGIYAGLPGIGFHYFQALEYSSAATSTFTGDLGVTYSQTGLRAAMRY